MTSIWTDPFLAGTSETGARRKTGHIATAGFNKKDIWQRLLHRQKIILLATTQLTATQFEPEHGRGEGQQIRRAQWWPENQTTTEEEHETTNP